MVVLACVVIVQSAMLLGSGDQWIEVKSAHFTVMSNAGQGSAKTLAWQLEQIRSAIAALWSWARVDLNKPLLVLAVKDEASMKGLVPSYWEKKGGVHPESVWVGGVDQSYLAIRTDVKVEDNGNVNPYVTSYFSYVSLILRQSGAANQPLWFTRGLAGVLSNTIVQESGILLGPPIPWHLQRLRESSRVRLADVIQTTSDSPEFKREEGLITFDAQSWALVHFLMFGNAGAHWPKLDQFSKLVAQGTNPDVAFREALGPPAALEGEFANYISRSLYSYRRVNIDATVKREGFTVRSLPAAESASDRALFHTAMNRPVEARSAIAEARQADAAAADSFVAEGLLLEKDGNKDAARSAYTRAVEGGSSNAYASYRLAGLLWEPSPAHDTLAKMETLLAKAVALNPKDPAASAYYGEIRSELGTSGALAYALRAISIDPSEPSYHLSAARILWRDHQLDEAGKQAQIAASLAQDEDDKREARELQDSFARARAATTSAKDIATTVGSVTTTDTSVPVGAAGTSAAGSTEDNTIDACRSGTNGACATLLPRLVVACAAKNAQACGTAGFLYEHGQGTTIDLSRAADFYRQSCDAGENLGCVAFAAMQARGTGVPTDEPAASALLQKTCDQGRLEGCTQLAVLLAGHKPPDLVRTRQLLTKACDGKYQPACDLLKSLPR